MLSSIHKAILAIFAIVMLVLLLPVTQANAEQILVCKASENAFDALDNNCDGDVDDIQELDNLGLVTGKDWYKTMSPGTPQDLCITESGSSQCFSSRDVSSCTYSESGGYYCDVTYDGSSTGDPSSNSSIGSGSGSGSGSSSDPTQPALPRSPGATNALRPSTYSTPASTTPSDEETGSKICAYFLGVEKCLTDTDNGNNCVNASNGLFYCSKEPNQQPDPNICVAVNEVYNGIDDNCDGKIDEDLEQPSTVVSPIPTLTTASSASAGEADPTVVSAPASAFIFALGLITLIYTRQKSLKTRT